ncbi:MAG: imelysin [Prevotella sp.]|nr:imelysin [Candidatus Prevotella equi]
MKKIINYVSVALMALSMTTVSCSSSEDNDNNVVPDNYNAFADKTYGTLAIARCASIVEQMEAANAKIEGTALTAEQESYLKDVLANLVDAVIVPTYTQLADNTEKLEATLNGLTAETITQAEINEACRLFGEARVQWERSEAFLGGAASDFSVDPTIDSWPLSRTALHTYLTGKMNPEDLDDESILGFHALEFILFRNGQPRKVSEFKNKDTYNGFQDVDGSSELTYAQQVCKLLKQRTFQLQVAWEGKTTANAARYAEVQNAGLDLTTANGLTFGEDLKQAGSAKSKYATVKDAVAQILSDEEGSAAAIANEVGTAKIANPFSAGEISYVESPYSYRSIVDFQDNIRSVRNVWCGNLDGNTSADIKSFWSFFNTYSPAVNNTVVASYNQAIDAIGAMPAPFVKYCCTIHNKEFSEDEYEGEE